jgi:deazaflavin-dependent oxidoreductase (nitroreductase family)
MVDYLRVADRSWPLLGRLMNAHGMVYRATGGRIGGRLPGLPPMLVLDHVGAKTGKRHSTPLVYMPDGEDFVVVGAKGGYPKHPGWVHNLRAHPDAEVQVGSSRIRVHAREADAEERRRLWPKAVAYNPLWDRYQRRTERTVPLVVLRPKAD